ncbi:MAG: DUF1905 domain-containing protein [Mesorhizobium sp.]|nr:MAG: DUF1905 domain-containing protein [Mesorhizobium sp.]
MLRYEMQGGIWVYPGKGGWHFITLPTDVIGRTKWTTSLFPDKASGSLLLPVKASVRQAESLKAGDAPIVTIEIAL